MCVRSNLRIWPYRAAPVEDSLTSGESLSALERQVTESFLELQKPIYRYLRGAAGDAMEAQEAEDLTQEVFLRLFADLRKGRSVTNVRAWVFRVAHNLIVDRIRQQRAAELSRVEEAEIDRREDPAPTAEQALLESECRRKVGRALGRLSPQERNCVQLRSQGLRYRDIAEVLAVRVPTVQTLLGRAMRKIVSALE